MDTQPEQQNFELNDENCLGFLIKMVEGAAHTFNLQEAELVNRGVRHLKGLKQFSQEFEKDMTKDKALEILMSAATLAHSRKAFSLDDASIVSYCMAFFQKKKEKAEKGLAPIPEEGEAPKIAEV